MNRRKAIHSIGVAAALPLYSTELFALGREAQARLHQRQDGTPYRFQTLDARESEVLSTACELILPETDTPGARSAKVPEFIDVVLTDWFNDEERERFLKGLRELAGRGAGFLSSTPAEQVGFLSEMETAALADPALEGAMRRARKGALSSPSAPFFTVLKWLTLYGYFTSEVGMERELEYVDFPGTYDGCSPLKGR
jgi:hypothetical protein